MKWIKQTFIAIFAISMLVSCEYDFIEVAVPEPPNPTDTINFATEVEPIFTSANCTNCHNGGLPLNLSAGAAFSSLMDLGMVVPFDPEASKIYTYPHPVTGTHNTKFATVDQANIIYGWIFQGALDN
ncbi:MAG: hypothetical protein K9H49_08430 [Bacteroidales bacterium]|nr:hypothetical protein [Bacteroidales bacterium]MCF8404734.1 hypothetical protein [Bacteroidales bacterium]